MITTDINILRAKNDFASLEEAKEIITILEKELKNSPIKGVGLAAPQIGINKKVAIVRTKKESIDLVNPIIVQKENGFTNFNEGCLSLPGVLVNTRRFKEVFIKDEIKPEGFIIIGFPAVVVQHECDHLEGILITDRAIGKIKIGRNDKCFCNSGKKYKKCCGK